VPRQVIPAWLRTHGVRIYTARRSPPFPSIQLLEEMVNWDAANDRRLLLLALKVCFLKVLSKQLKGAIDYKLLAAEFDPNISLNALRIRMHQLRNMDSAGRKVKSGRVAKGKRSSYC
jgi:hypothetical protein